MDTNTHTTAGRAERTAMTVLREIAAGSVTVGADERRRVMLMAQGEARCGHPACIGCDHLSRDIGEESGECTYGRDDPSACPAVAAALQVRASAMRGFIVKIKNGATVVRQFEAMGTDSMTVAAQHESLCDDGEYVNVLPLARASELQGRSA